MKKILKAWAAPLMCGLFVFLLFKFVFFWGYVPTASMEPVIKAGSCIIGFRIVGDIRRGDIVAFERDGQMLVKRVAGVPGDVIYIDDASLIIGVNDELQGATRVLTVPDGCYFMLGDNAKDSIDSRYWEEPFVECAQMIARVWR